MISTGRLLPDYYLQNFHFQTDGWMSTESARRYDYQAPNTHARARTHTHTHTHSLTHSLTTPPGHLPSRPLGPSYSPLAGARLSGPVGLGRPVGPASGGARGVRARDPPRTAHRHDPAA